MSPLNEPMTDVLASDGGEQPAKAYPERWRTLWIYMLLALANQTTWLTFSPIPDQMAKRYEVSQDWIQGLMISSTVLFLPGSWLCARILRRADLRRAVVLGSLLQVLGTVLRLFADELVRPALPVPGFALLFFGQDLAAIVSPIFMNTPALLAEDWFTSKDREIAMAMAVFSPIVGQGLGSACAGLLATGDRGEGVEWVIRGEVMLCCFGAILAIVGFRAKPPTPPRRTACIQASEDSVLATWGRLLVRPQFLLVLLIFDAGMGIATSVTMTYGKLAGDCGYSGLVAGSANGIFVVCGIVGAMASSWAMGRTKAYRTCLRCTVSLAVIWGAAFLGSLRPDRPGALLVTTGLFGMCLMSCLPVLIANSVEETFPATADSSTSLLFVSSIILQVVVPFLLDTVHKTEANACGGILTPSRLFVLSFACLGCFIPAMAYQGKCNRRLFEELQFTSADLTTAER